MGPSLAVLAEPDTQHGLILAFFLMAFLCTLLRSFFSHDASGYHKFCGALAIFILALRVNNLYFYGISVLIGGTVVASENFIIKLTSLLRSDKASFAAVVASVLRTAEQASKPALEMELKNLSSSTPKIGGPDAPHKE